MTDNMLDDNVLGSVDNQENVEAHHEREHDPRRRRRRDTVLHQPQPNINQVSCVPATDSWFLPMLSLSAAYVYSGCRDQTHDVYVCVSVCVCV